MLFVYLFYGNLKHAPQCEIFPAPFITDINECASSEANDCDPNALCTNTEGSHVCRCRNGYQGDGKNCAGGLTFAKRFSFLFCFVLIACLLL